MLHDFVNEKLGQVAVLHDFANEKSTGASAAAGGVTKRRAGGLLLLALQRAEARRGCPPVGLLHSLAHSLAITPAQISPLMCYDSGLFEGALGPLWPRALAGQ